MCLIGKSKDLVERLTQKLFDHINQQINKLQTEVSSD